MPADGGEVQKVPLAPVTNITQVSSKNPSIYFNFCRSGYREASKKVCRCRRRCYCYCQPLHSRLNAPRSPWHFAFQHHNRIRQRILIADAFCAVLNLLQVSRLLLLSYMLMQNMNDPLNTTMSTGEENETRICRGQGFYAILKYSRG